MSLRLTPTNRHTSVAHGSEDKENQTFRNVSGESGGVTRLDTSNGAISTPPFFIFEKMSRLIDMFELDKLNECTMECTRQSRWKETTQRYIANMLQNNIALQKDILEHRYKVSPTIDFKLNERGKVRNIEAPVVRDRIVQKTLMKHVLIPNIRPYLIYDNYASLSKRGTSFARKRFEIMLRRYIHVNGTDGYILLFDIRKFFENIDHQVLKDLIAPKLEREPADVQNLIHYVIDTSSKTDKGLNLGSECPQIFATYYPTWVDTLVKVVKGYKFYGRYMDDGFVIANTKQELRDLLKEIEQTLGWLKLELNEKKTCIVKLSHGFTYLQIKYSILPSGKILKRMSPKKVIRERRRLKAFRRMVDAGTMTVEEVRNCYMSWRGTVLKDHNACYKSLQSLDRLCAQLFPEAIGDKEKPSRNDLAKAIYNDGETNDLRYCLTNKTFSYGRG